MGYQPDFDILSLIVIATIIGIAWFVITSINDYRAQRKYDENELKHYRELEKQKKPKKKNIKRKINNI